MTVSLYHFWSSVCSVRPRLLDLQTAVLLAPATIRLLRYADPTANFANRLALRHKHVRFTKMVDDLLD